MFVVEFDNLFGVFCLFVCFLTGKYELAKETRAVVSSNLKPSMGQGARRSDKINTNQVAGN